MWYNTAMLLDDINRGESDTLEFKECLPDDSAKWLKTAVAFANCRGGKILFGVSDNREIVGLDGDIFAAKDAIVDAVADACEPALPISVGVSTVDGRPIVVLEVYEGRNTPYFIKAQGAKDGVYVRYDATTRKADGAAIRDLLVSSSGRSYDQYECRGLKVTESGVARLCRRLYETARANAGNDEQRALIRPVTKAQLIKWRVLLQEGGGLRPTNAFALLSGSAAFAVETKCAVFKGSSRDVFVDRRSFGGPVQEQVEAAFKYVLSKINMGGVIDGLFREDVYEMPPSAIRELIVNAIVHRNYVNGDASAVSVALYDDRLEITSPGRLPYGVTIRKMFDGYSECRNKALAPAFAYMHLIEDWGSGIPRIVERVKAAGLPDIKFEAWSTAVRATIFRKRIDAKAYANSATIGGISAKTAGHGANGDGSGANAKLPRREVLKRLAFEWIAAHPGCARKDLAKAIDCSLRSVQRVIDELLCDGRVKSCGKTKGQGYFVV